MSELLTYPDPDHLKRRLLARRVITDDGCWEYAGSRNPLGYGQIGVQRHSRLAHRVAYVVLVGPFASSLYVCHRCDNPPCFNPDHLFLGTQADNIGDCIRKGRLRGGNVYGERHHSATATDEDVARARDLYASGRWSFAALGREFGVTPRTITQWVTYAVRVPAEQARGWEGER